MQSAADYQSLIDPNRRLFYGQDVTLPAVAHFMTEWVLGSGFTNILDPAFGLGTFLEEAQDANTIEFTGYEIDPEILSLWVDFVSESNTFQSRYGYIRETGKSTRKGNGSLRSVAFKQYETAGHKIRINEKDYLSTWNICSSNIVCEPPCIGIKEPADRIYLEQRFLKHLKHNIPRRADAPYIFLLKSLSELTEGRLAYLMPLKFLGESYGKMLKSRLISESHLHSIIQLNFQEATEHRNKEPVGLILYDKTQRFNSVKFCNVENISELRSVLSEVQFNEIPMERLEPERNWSIYLKSNYTPVVNDGFVPLSHYGRFTRGIVTGANQFFLLRPSDTDRLQLDHSETQTCISRLKQIDGLVLRSRDVEILLSKDSQMLIFMPKTGEHSQGASQYIRSGEISGINQRSIPFNRKTWV